MVSVGVHGTGADVLDSNVWLVGELAARPHSDILVGQLEGVGCQQYNELASDGIRVRPRAVPEASLRSWTAMRGTRFLGTKVIWAYGLHSGDPGFLVESKAAA